MTTVATRHRAFPSRNELRQLSRWVWVLLLLALVVAVVYLTRDQTVDPSALFSAFALASPLLTAAALIAVAPRQRMIVASAVGFAIPPVLTAIQTFFTRDMHDLLRMSIPAYLSLSDAVLGVAGIAQSLHWLFGLVAVLCLAFHMGTVKSQRGWWIVGVGLAIAGVQLAANIVNMWPVWTQFADAPEAGIDPIRQLAGAALGSLSLVAWGYLTAVAAERRFVMFALAGAVRLTSSAVGLTWFAVIGTGVLTPTDAASVDGLNLGFQLFFTGTAVLEWVLLIAGIFRELPRDEHAAAALTVSLAEADSPGR